MNESKYFLGYPDLNAYLGITAKTVAIALGFLALFMIIAYVYNIVATTFSSKGRQLINFAKLGNVIVLAVVLTFYIPVSYTICKLMSLMEAASRPNLSQSDVEKIFSFQNNASNSPTGPPTYEDFLNMQYNPPDLTDKEKEEAIFENQNSNKESTFKTLGKLAVFIVAKNNTAEQFKGLFRLLIAFLNKQLIVLFFVLGPFACLFSILPGFQSKFITWLTTYITVLFVPIVFNVLDAILFDSFVWLVQHGNIADAFIFNIVNFVTILLYILPYWISGKIVGNADSGKFLALTGQATMMGIGLASKLLMPIAGTKFGGGGASAAGSVSNVASSSQDAMTP